MPYDLQLSLLHTDSFPRVERGLLTVETSPLRVLTLTESRPILGERNRLVTSIIPQGRIGFFDSCEFPPNCPTERTTDGIDKKVLIFKVIIVLTIWRPV